MLTPEQALEALRQAERGDARIVATFKAMPEPQRLIGFGLLGLDPEGRMFAPDNWKGRNKFQAESDKAFEAMAPEAQGEVWSAFFPRLDGRLFEAAGQVLDAEPYLQSFLRQPFRAPGRLELTRARRLQWLRNFIELFAKYDPDLDWIAAWSAHVDIFGTASGPFLAAAIDQGGPQGRAVRETLRDSASGTHEIGAMGNHVLRSMLASSDPESWEFIETLLLAAQRQEGLRQSILEAVVWSHPGAFRRMLRQIVEHDPARFSATVQALNTWLGFAWDSASVKVVNHTLDRLINNLDEPEARTRALSSGGSEDAYLALWALAFEDAPAAVEPASRLLDDPDIERRYAAVHLLAQLQLFDDTLPPLMKALEDPDLRIALRAIEAFPVGVPIPEAKTSDLFERVERLMARLPAKPRVLEPILWPWQTQTADRTLACATLLDYQGQRPIARMIKHLPAMNPRQRSHLVRNAIEAAPDAAETRALLLDMMSDASEWVRTVVFAGMKKIKVDPEEARRIEALLSRKPADLRYGVVMMLFNQDDGDALASADRLLASPKPEPRRAGLELLRQLAEAKRCLLDCRQRAAVYQEARPALDGDEATQLDAILRLDRKIPTLDDALGLVDPALKSKAITPIVRDREWLTPAALACLQSLEELVNDHRDEPISVPFFDESLREGLLGNLQGIFPGPDPKLDLEQDAARLPLREVWEAWWASRPAELRDPDGLELVRARAMIELRTGKAQALSATSPTLRFPDAIARIMGNAHSRYGLASLTYLRAVSAILLWLIRLHPPGGMADYLLDAIETAFARVPAKMLGEFPKPDEVEPPDWRDFRGSLFTHWLEATLEIMPVCPGSWDDAHDLRLFRLLRWRDEPGPPVPRHFPPFDLLLKAFKQGEATAADLFEQILGPEFKPHSQLRSLTGRKPSSLFQEYPGLRDVVDRCRARILKVELDRGDLATAASGPALELRAMFGSSTLVRLLRAIGKASFNRSHGWHRTMDKESVLSHLIRVSFPDDADTPETFAALVKPLALPADRLVELAVFAPQWARFVKQASDWPMLEDAVWWLHAHTKASDWEVDAEIREVWTAEVAARTPLTGADLVDGAVDVVWFHRVYQAIGPKRWPTLDEAARFASSGNGHARARLFASAMRGQVKKAELINRATKKRYADAVRALGLVPLSKGAGGRKDLLDRYQVIQEFVRTSKQFGAMRQANEKRAGAIALTNLARTAGYPDPIRLEWAMEAQSVADLAEGPVVVEVDGVTVSLAIDDQGWAELTVSRAGKPLKAIPPSVKKHAKVAGLVDRKADLKRQASRVRLSLEAAMCRGDLFTADEVRQLAGHAVLWPLLGQLVLLGEGIAGYPVEGGRALRNHAGVLEPIKPTESIRIAHPHDLLVLDDWHLWQRECFEAERVQPFKQVFRELYVLTEAEKGQATRSSRYEGHQVNPGQAVALLGARGWVSHPEEGIRKTFHEAGLTASMDVMGLTFGPADVEGITIEAVQFASRGEWSSMPLEQVPPRLFSEVMRDLDLVVSVAHRGGVDPEATVSTVEMRSGLLRETCQLLRLENVRLAGSHALIEGTLGSYSLHLGSGVVHRRPGGSLCIVPVHAQHRGRLFLPFADDDPKTAEVISKALLLARDSEIQDPTILAQIRASR